MSENLRRRHDDAPMAILLLSVMGAFAEFALIRERQREVIEIAKRRGVCSGRRPLALEQIAELRCRALSGAPRSGLARDFGVSRETVHQYLRSVDPAEEPAPAP